MGNLKRPFAHPVEVTNINNSLRVKEGRIQFHVPKTVAKNLVSVVSKENSLGHPCKQYTEQPWKIDKKICIW